MLCFTTVWTILWLLSMWSFTALVSVILVGIWSLFIWLCYGADLVTAIKYKRKDSK